MRPVRSAHPSTWHANADHCSPCSESRYHSISPATVLYSVAVKVFQCSGHARGHMIHPASSNETAENTMKTATIGRGDRSGSLHPLPHDSASFLNFCTRVEVLRWCRPNPYICRLTSGPLPKRFLKIAIGSTPSCEPTHECPRRKLEKAELHAILPDSHGNNFALSILSTNREAYLRILLTAGDV